MRLLITFILVFVFNLSSAFAKDCDVQIKANEGTKKLNSILSCLKNEIQTLKAMKVGNSSFPKVVDQSLFRSGKKAKSLNKFTYSFPKCIRENDIVQCTILVRNKDERNRRALIYMKDSTAFSDRMTKDRLVDARIANESKTTSGSFYLKIPSRVIIPLYFNIEGTPTNALYYQNISLYHNAGNLTFNNVPIE